MTIQTLAAFRACNDARAIMRNVSREINAAGNYDAAHAALSSAYENAVLAVCTARINGSTKRGMRELDRTLEIIDKDFHRYCSEIRNRF